MWGEMLLWAGAKGRFSGPDLTALTIVLPLGLGVNVGLLCEDAQGREVATGMLMVAASVPAAKAW